MFRMKEQQLHTHRWLLEDEWVKKESHKKTNRNYTYIYLIYTYCIYIYIYIFKSLVKKQENDLENKYKSVFNVVFREQLQPSGDRLNEFKDLIGIIQWFMNYAAFHLANRNELQETYKVGDFFM